MKNNDTNCDCGMRRGAALEHGRAHAKDHQVWSRRRFLYSAGAAAGASVMVGSTPVSAHAFHPMMNQLRDLTPGRSLVLVQMFGGFDGLNTIIPVDDPVYNNQRPDIKISRSQAVMLNSQFGLHPSLSDLYPLWSEGKMAVVHNVGYPDPNLSHFRSNDIWTSSSDSNVIWTEGWIGRAMEAEFPDIVDNPPDKPLAVEIGSQPSAIALGAEGQTGVVIKSPEDFYRIAATGNVFDPSDVPASMAGIELTYLREVANQANRYAGHINDAATAASNLVSFPGTTLAESLAIISRLIRGGLESRVYIVRINGWDTHVNQLSRMNSLYGQVGPAISAFWADLKAGNAEDDVMMMTFSEFGRRVNQNLSQGTDHGTSNPMLLFGSDSSMQGGFHGTPQNLADLDKRGNPKFSTDFRDVYGTVLSGWLGVNCNTADLAIGKEIQSLALVEPNAADGKFCAVGLPVELTNFKARQDGDHVLVEWETATETDNAGFELQVAYEDQLFNPMASIEGQGTTSAVTRYSHEIELDPGEYRLRLLQTDFDGTRSYSEVLNIEVETAAAIVVKPPYPNPVNTRATIEFAVRESDELKMDLYDMTGRLVRSLYNSDVEGGRTYKIQFNALDLASGVYSIRTISGLNVRTDSVVVTR